MKLRMFILPDGPHGDIARGNLYRPYMKSCGRNFKVGTNAYIYNPNGLSVGDNVYIGFNSYLGQGEINLADEVLVGNFVSITASNHISQGKSFRFGGFEMIPISIGPGTWLAAHVCIMPGVNIGEGCLVAAGSIVTRSFEEERLIIAGVPAEKIGELEKS